MPTKRRKGEAWEYVVKRKALLPRPLYLRFSSEREGDAYVARLEAMLARGIVPPELINGGGTGKTITEVIRGYYAKVSVPASDRAILDVLIKRIGDHKLRYVTYAWVEDWVKGMKHDLVLTPNTIRHYVGALNRCFDWVVRRGDSELASNPIGSLPKRYATYNTSDEQELDRRQIETPKDQQRDRRMTDAEEQRIRAVLAGAPSESGSRALTLRWQGALEAVFGLALETAMRMREIYTLERKQVDLKKRTVFLDRTKNGDKRQVPLSSVAVDIFNCYVAQVKSQSRGMEGFSFPDGRLFPWWNGNDVSLRATTALLSQQFARAFAAADCADLHFHDLRHEATSRLYEKTALSDLEIAKITGHKDMKMLARYANLRGSTLATKLW